MHLPEPPTPLSIDPIEETAGHEWLMTYADLMTLLLVFFVLLFSFSSLNVQRFKQAVSSIRVSLGQSMPPSAAGDRVGGSGVLENQTSIDPQTQIAVTPTDVLRQIQRVIAHHLMADHIDAYTANGKIIIQVRGTVLFDSGRADLDPKGIPVLDGIAAIIEQFPEYDINIKGHTDNVPIQTPRFGSNWDLSAIRATTVLKHLIERGITPQRLTATGYGDSIPLAANDSEAGKARNRRVEFVLEKTDR